jgi:glycosyltransferase involved in cell wall biosynthesis
MKERIWLSNYSLDDIQGGTEIVGEQYCRAMKLKYISARKVGIPIGNPEEKVSSDLDSWIKKLDLGLIVYNSVNCSNKKPKADKSIAVCCENFMTEANSVLDENFKNMKYGQWGFQRKSIENADKVITLTTGEQKAFAEDGFESTVIEPYLNLDTFYPKRVIDDNEITAIFVGRRHVRKGYDIILELEKMLPGLKFIKVTDGGLTSDALNDLYNKANFLVMPSRYESFGFIYAEALATNLPIISSRVGLFKDWQPEEYGIFPEEITAKAFEDAILHDLPKHNFKKSRELAEKRFSYERFKRECDDLLNNW